VLLEEIALELHAGEIVALVGANGSGKSSLLLTLAGVLPALHGRVEGQRAGLVFQNPEHQFLRHTVADEIRYGLAPLRSARECDAIVAFRLREHRLEHLADQNPHRLSGGEKRRLSLAAMLAHDRPVLLADEPTFGLDRRDTMATAQQLRTASAGSQAVLFSSHDLRFVAALADRVIVLGRARTGTARLGSGDPGSATSSTADEPVSILAAGPTESVLSNTAMLHAAGIAVPPLVSWLLLKHPGALRQVLTRLESAVPAPRHPTPAGTS
jgi:energy-coupling factor transport system ATP-binding protein